MYLCAFQVIISWECHFWFVCFVFVVCVLCFSFCLWFYWRIVCFKLVGLRVGLYDGILFVCYIGSWFYRGLLGLRLLWFVSLLRMACGFCLVVCIYLMVGLLFVLFLAGCFRLCVFVFFSIWLCGASSCCGLGWVLC